MRWVHATLLVLGGALFAWLVAAAGLQTLWSEARLLGLGVVAIIAVEGLGDFLHTCAWQRCFTGPHRPARLRLWGPHLAGAAINFTTPTATLGGEVVRATLVPEEVAATEVAASLVINKLAASLADTAIAITGVGILLASAPVSHEWRVGMLAGVGLLVCGVIIFFLLQRGGRMAGILGRYAAAIGLLGRERVERGSRFADDIDRRLAAFHAENSAALLGAVALHLAGVSVGALQLYLFLRMIGAPTDPATVATVFFVARAIDLMSFFVPARLGAQEGARMFAMSLVGIESSLGLLFSLVLRLEQLAWAAIGFGAYAGVLWQQRREARAVRVTS